MLEALLQNGVQRYATMPRIPKATFKRQCSRASRLNAIVGYLSGPAKQDMVSCPSAAWQHGAAAPAEPHVAGAAGSSLVPSGRMKRLQRGHPTSLLHLGWTVADLNLSSASLSATLPIEAGAAAGAQLVMFRSLCQRRRRSVNCNGVALSLMGAARSRIELLLPPSFDRIVHAQHCRYRRHVAEHRPGANSAAPFQQDFLPAAAGWRLQQRTPCSADSATALAGSLHDRAPR